MDKKKIPIHLSYTFTSTEFLSNFESSFDPWGTVSAGDELPYVPNHQLFAEAGLESELLSCYFRFRQIGRMRTVAGSDKITPLFSTDDISLLDFSVDYTITESNILFVNIYNIFNNSSVVAARPAGLRPTMPRNIVAGIKIKL